MKEKETQKPKETQIGPYEIKAKIGQGGTSVVYRAVDSRNQRVVALKVLTPLFATDPKFLRRFINEGKNVKRLDHPNIVQVYDADEAEGRQYIAMELVEGGSLSELIKNRNTLLPTDEALNIVEQIASALDYAHGLGILHRDIKLSNVLLTHDGRALLTDFGSAKHMYGEHTIVTQSGFSVGTPTFMSPEQAKGDPEIDRRTDVYSLGVAAYAVLVGRLPFKADSQVALLHKIIYDPPPLPEQVNPEIAPGIAYALKRVLSKDPPMRYSTAGEFAAALIEGKSWVPGTQDYTNIPTYHHGTGTFFVPQQHVQKSRSLLSLLPLLLMSVLSALAIIFGLLIWLNKDFRNIVIGNSVAVVNPPITDLGTPPPTRAESLKPVVLDKYLGENFSLNVPVDWSNSTIDNTVNFDSPELFARLFVQRLEGDDVDKLPGEVIDRYLASIGETYHNREIIDDSPRDVGAIAARQQILTANWLGKDVTVRLIGLQEQGQSYVIGSIVASEYDPLLSTVLNSVADSFTVNPVSIAALPKDGDDNSNDSGDGDNSNNTALLNTPLPSEAGESTGTPTLTSTPSDGDMSTPKPTNTAASTRVSLQVPTETNTPVNTATELPTDTPTATTTNTPTATRTPTETARPTNSPVPTRTPTDVPTPSRTPTDVPTPTRTPTDIPTPTNTSSPTDTATPVPTETPTNEPTATETATPRPTNTDVPTSTRTPTRTPTQQPTATATDTAVPTLVPPTPIPDSASPIPGAVIQPVSPAPNSDGGDRVTFEWSANFTPRPGQGFELVFWRPGQTPIANSFGLAAPTIGTNVSADLASLDNTLGELLDPGEYQWGILLVQQQPYRRVQYLGGGWPFRYVRGSSGSSSSRSPSSGE